MAFLLIISSLFVSFPQIIQRFFAICFSPTVRADAYYYPRGNPFPTPEFPFPTAGFSLAIDCTSAGVMIRTQVRTIGRNGDRK
jgi:hypothetical protein